MVSIKDIDLIELFDSYVALRKLEDNSELFGNVVYITSFLSVPDNIIKLFEYIYDNYCEVL